MNQDQEPPVSIPVDSSTAKRTWGGRLRAYFLAGLVITAPVAITLWAIWSFVTWVDHLIKPLLPTVYNPDHYLPIPVPGVGFILAIVGLTLIGALAANILGRTLIYYWDLLLYRMPVVRNIYKGLKQIFETAFSPEGGFSFKRVVLIEFPRKGTWAIAFVARTFKENSEILWKTKNTEMVGVFIPTTPNPTSGYIVFVPPEEIIYLDMTVEEGVKAIVSAGLVFPEGPELNGAPTAGARNAQPDDSKRTASSRSNR